MSRRLDALRVSNFKAFAESQRIPLKPITLIFGPNSAGKSSFIHSLALAHEAQFGREKRSLARLDVHHTDVGGTAIDLGGFRQYVHRGQASKRVEWGADLNVSALDARLAQLLAPVDVVTVSIAIGIELDDQERPRPGADPRVESVAITCAGAELLRMSRRKSDGKGSLLRLDRLASDHAVFRQVFKAIVESATTSEEMRPEDFEAANEAIAGLLPELMSRVDQFLPSGVEVPKTEGAELSPTSMLFPVSRGNRREDIAQAVRFYLPRTLNDLVRGVAEEVAGELKRMQYLGPLRSFPPRHLAFAEHEDANWYAGGGYAWDVVRRDDTVREAVNRWLGSEKLKTPYKLAVRSLVALDQMRPALEDGLQSIQDHGGLGMEVDYDVDRAANVAVPSGNYPVIKDVEESAAALLSSIRDSEADRVKELVLLDQRTNTVVTHRDVGIGISQVLPVLVMAYGSRGKLLAMEQPEIHLHPALQAELGDVMIEAALGVRQNSLILETHSEHLVLRLLRRIRETTSGERAETELPVTPQDCCILYVHPTQNGSEVLHIPVTADGDFATQWPEGFFGERARELF